MVAIEQASIQKKCGIQFQARGRLALDLPETLMGCDPAAVPIIVDTAEA